MTTSFENWIAALRAHAETVGWGWQAASRRRVGHGEGHRTMKKPTAIINGEGLFASTFAPDQRASAELQANAHDLEIRPFGVVLDVVDPTTNVASAWRKVEGWSTWIWPLGMFRRRQRPAQESEMSKPESPLEAAMRAAYDMSAAETLRLYGQECPTWDEMAQDPRALELLRSVNGAAIAAYLQARTEVPDMCYRSSMLLSLAAELAPPAEPEFCDHEWAIKDGRCSVCDAEWPEPIGEHQEG